MRHSTRMRNRILFGAPPSHREIAERIIGRAIRHFEHVHHIDGDHSNNDPNNLLVVDRNDHNRIHHGLAPLHFYWPGELVVTDCEILEYEIHGTEPKPRLPKATLTRADLRIMKL